MALSPYSTVDSNRLILDLQSYVGKCLPLFHLVITSLNYKQFKMLQIRKNVV